MKYRHIIFVLLFSAALPAWAQQSRVRGFVVDNSDKKPLQGVNIVLLDGQTIIRGTSTDGDGYFVINRVSAGEFNLRASFVGYESQTLAISTRQGNVPTVQISLEPAPAVFDELIVEAERQGGAVTSAGLQTVVPADIQRLPMPGVTGDLVSVLQSAPSVVTSGDRGGQLFIRGGEPTQNFILLDGIQLYQPFHILGFYSAFPSEIVDNASVYAGGFGAKFGGRISSVVDIEARNGNKQRLSGTVSVSPFLSTVHFEGPIVPNRISIIGAVRESLVKDVIPDLYGQKLPYSFGDQFVKLHAQPTSGTSFSTTLIHTHDRGDIAGTRRTILGDIDNTAIVDTSEIGWENFGVGSSFMWLPGRFPIRTEISGAFSSLDTDLGTPGAPERRAEVSGYNVDAEFSYSLGGNDFRLGFFAASTDLEYSLSGSFQDVADTDTSSVSERGVHTELTLRPASRVEITPGLRLHTFPNRNSTSVEPRVRAVLPFTFQNVNQQFSFASGLYRQGIVGLTDERDAGNVFTVWTVPPETSELPRAAHVIGGWQGTAEVEEQVVIKASVEVYYKKLTNLSVPVWDSFPQFTTALQSAEGTASGVDARLEVNVPNFYGYVGYGRSTTKYSAVEGEVFGTFFGGAQDQYNPPHDRRNQLSAVGRLDVGEITLTAQWQYGTGLPYTQAVGFDDFLLVTGPDNNFLEQAGQSRVLYEAPYSSNLPDYHRLDLWLERAFDTNKVSGMVRAGVVNAYNRANLFYFDLFTLNRVEQLPALPSVGLRLEF